MRSVRIVASLVLAGAPLLPPPTASGQELEASAGVAVPVGEFGEFVDVGPAVSLGVRVPMSARVSLQVRGWGEFFSGIPSVQAWHYLAGVGVSLADPATSHWTVAVDGMAGATSFGSEVTPRIGFAPPPRAEQLDTSATITVGARLARRQSARLDLFLEVRWVLMFTEGETVVAIDGTSEGFQELSSVPVMIGLHWRP